MQSLSQELRSQLYGQTSDDPFLMLVTMKHESFDTLRFVNDAVDIESRGNTFVAFPIKITLPTDDGEAKREVKMSLDNVSLELIDELRSVVTPISAKIEMVLASQPDVVQMEVVDLLLRNITYNRQTISATLHLDDFLNTEMASERYTPTTFPGIF